MLTNEKKQQLINDSEKWWEHELERPIIQVVLTGDKKPKYSRGELLKMLYDFDIDEKDVAKAYRDTLECNTYMGDAFPQFYMRSTGILGAMLNQTYTIDVDKGTIWFEEMKGKEIDDIHLKLDEKNKLFIRAVHLIHAFNEEFHDDIALGIPNLGGMMDIVESIRGANNSLMDLYDEPENVKRLNDEIYDAYVIAYKRYIKEISETDSFGYTGWITLLSQKPYFISQCDFCCMIGEEQFEEFVKDTLSKEAKLIERSFYHLDGPGAVRHLDTIIECGFDGIQWINGAGSEPLDDEKWTTIYKKIHDANMLLQVFCYGKDELKFIDHIVDVVGTTKGLSFICDGYVGDKELFEKYLDKYNVPR